MSIFRSIFKASGDDVRHSSGLAKPTNNQSFGSASSESFESRQSVERNRNIISSYRQSGIVNRREKPRIKPSATTTNQSSGLAMDAVVPTNRNMHTTTPQVSKPTYSFREPPSRGYDPYR